MKNIARLIVAIPTLLVAPLVQESVAQDFPSTGLGGFEGSVVEVPEASIPLPGASARQNAPMLPSASDIGNALSKATRKVSQETYGDVIIPARKAPSNPVGGYQTVFDKPGAAGGSSPIVQAPSSTRSPQLNDPSPIITVEPDSQLSLPSSPREFQPTQSRVIEQSNGYAQSPQQYSDTQGEVYIEGDYQNFDGGCADGSCQDFYVDESEMAGRGGRQRVRRPRRVAQQAPLRQANRNIGQRSNGRVFSTVGASGLLFNRNYGGNRDFSTNGGDTLSSRDATFDTLPGVDAFIARRRANGIGWEGRYFGLYPTDQSIQIGGSPTNLLPGLDQVGTSFTGVGNNTTLTGPSASTYFDLGDPHVLTRQTDLHNFEVNLLRNGIPRLRACQTEYLLGFRYIQFGETLLAESIGITGGDPAFVTPESVGYFSTAENKMLGVQIGARSDYQLQDRLMIHLGVKAGAFNNTINTRQRVDYRMPDGSTINPTVAGGTLGGRRFDIGTEDEVKSLLLELDLAASVQVSNAARVRVGYRAVGLTDIAFASDQVRDNFNDATAVLNPTTDGTLVLQGTYIGLELAY